MTTRKSERQFDLIAFDWDGTLFDSTAIITRSIQAAVVDVGGARGGL
jgi:phosphoglycolate phosphatase